MVASRLPPITCIIKLVSLKTIEVTQYVNALRFCILLWCPRPTGLMSDVVMRTRGHVVMMPHAAASAALRKPPLLPKIHSPAMDLDFDLPQHTLQKLLKKRRALAVEDAADYLQPDHRAAWMLALRCAALMLQTHLVLLCLLLCSHMRVSHCGKHSTKKGHLPLQRSQCTRTETCRRASCQSGGDESVVMITPHQVVAVLHLSCTTTHNPRLLSAPWLCEKHDICDR